MPSNSCLLPTAHHAEATSCAELQRAAEASVQEAEASVVKSKQGGRNYTNHIYILHTLCFLILFKLQCNKNVL